MGFLLGTGGGGGERGGLHVLGDGGGGLEDEESLAALAELHGIVLLLIVDLEFDLLVRGAQDLVLSEADVEGRACQAAIFLLNDYHVNGTAQGGRVDGVPALGNTACERAHIVHVSARRCDDYSAAERRVCVAGLWTVPDYLLLAEVWATKVQAEKELRQTLHFRTGLPGSVHVHVHVWQAMRSPRHASQVTDPVEKHTACAVMGLSGGSDARHTGTGRTQTHARRSGTGRDGAAGGGDDGGDGRRALHTDECTALALARCLC